MEQIAASAVLALTRLLATLSLPQQRRVGRALGWLACKLPLDAVRVTRVNLTRCYPELSARQREQMVRSSVQQTALCLVEAGIIFHWPAARWLPLAVSIEGEALITDGRGSGRSVLVLVPHLGNWEYLALYLGKYGLTALYDPPRLRGLEEPVRRARNRAGANLVPIGRRGLRTIYHALSNCGVVALLPDQVPERDAGIYVDFFGEPALTMSLAQRLIVRTNPLVLFATALRTEQGFDLRFVEAESSIRSEDPSTAIAAMNRSIEALVREAPTQYQWEYKRFKRQPPGRPDWYRSQLQRHTAKGAARTPE